MPYAQDGCLETTAAVTLTPPDEAGGAVLVYHLSSLWCPGAGQVATTGAFEGDPVSSTSPAPQPAVEVQLGGRVPSWQHPEHWDAAAVSARMTDAVWGDTTYTTTPALQPVLVGDRLAVADVNSGDLALLQEDDAGLSVARLLRPGGDVTALGAVGELLVAATSQRDLVAYTAQGDRVWTRRTPDLVVAAPRWDGGDGLVVGGLDGTVRLIDARTGEDRWVAAVSADGIDSLIVVGDVAVAADRAGGVAAVDLADGAVRWTDEDDAEVDAFATDGEALFVARDDTVERLDAATGAEVWTRDTGSGIDDLAVVGDLVVAQTWDDLAGLDLDDGSIAWRAPIATAIASDGVSLVASSGTSIRLVAPDGSDLVTWPVAAESLGAFRYLTPGADAVWLTDAKAGIVRVGP